jgi:hypothetical protein
MTAEAIQFADSMKPFFEAETVSLDGHLRFRLRQFDFGFFDPPDHAQMAGARFEAPAISVFLAYFFGAVVIVVRLGVRAPVVVIF